MSFSASACVWLLPFFLIGLSFSGLISQFVHVSLACMIISPKQDYCVWQLNCNSFLG